MQDTKNLLDKTKVDKGESMKETVYCPNNKCGYHIKDEKELDEQTDACGNIICPNCGGMMAMT